MPHKVKKSLGQHFLNDLILAKNIVDSVPKESGRRVLEIGPGQGVLTQYLLEKDFEFKAIELDDKLIPYLKKTFPRLEQNLIHIDFLKVKLDQIFNGKSFTIIGNFPYNISTEIIFKMIKNRELVPMLIGMFQKEVAERIIAPPGSKIYGVTSVLTQAYYDGELLYEVPPESFNPPPKVHSSVIRLTRKEDITLDCNESLFKTIVKTAFRQRRKMLRNSLKSFLKEGTDLEPELLTERPEQLSVKEFIYITNKIDQYES